MGAWGRQCIEGTSASRICRHFNSALASWAARGQWRWQPEGVGHAASVAPRRLGLYETFTITYSSLLASDQHDQAGQALLDLPEFRYFFEVLHGAAILCCLARDKREADDSRETHLLQQPPSLRQPALSGVSSITILLISIVAERSRRSRAAPNPSCGVMQLWPRRCCCTAWSEP